MTVLPAYGGLPLRHGVSPSCVSLPPGPWSTFTDFLTDRFPAVGRSTWLERMAAGLVADESGQLVTAERPYRGHIRLYYYRALPREARLPFEAQVLHQDEHLVVADKPHFLPVIPSGSYLQETLLVRLKNQLGIADLVPLHRIDRETAGLVLFSVKPQDRNAYQALFRQRLIDKHYEAIALAPPAGMQLPLRRTTRIGPGTIFFMQSEIPGEPNSDTHVELLETWGSLARYALHPVTGKKHQLRLHMQALGMAIHNDRLYPSLATAHHVEPIAVDDYSRPLQLLAKGIGFADPITGEKRVFTSQRQLASLSGLQG